MIGSGAGRRGTTLVVAVLIATVGTVVAIGRVGVADVTTLAALGFDTNAVRPSPVSTTITTDPDG